MHLMAASEHRPQLAKLPPRHADDRAQLLMRKGTTSKAREAGDSLGLVGSARVPDDSMSV
jgi:hypothetical protein